VDPRTRRIITLAILGAFIGVVILAAL